MEQNDACPEHGILFLDGPEGPELPEVMPDAEEIIIPLRDAVEAYLRSRKVTMWPGHTFYLNRQDRLPAAVDWLVEVMEDVKAIHVMAVGSGARVIDVAVQYRKMKEGEQYGR